MPQRLFAAVAVAVPLVVAVLVGCSQSTTTTDAAAPAGSLPAGPPSATAPPATSAPEDYVATASDFTNINDLTPVRGFFVGNFAGHLDQALAVANDPNGGTYPVGTVIQLVPGEAMVKRRAGFDRGSNDWEWFDLDTTATGTAIRTRGGAEVVNRFGGSCSDCHSLAEPKYDFVCEQNHGCQPLPIGRDVIEALQKADPRPRMKQ